MSDHSITSLIEKLESASEGSRELDCEIWTATGGWDHVGRPPTFSNSLDAALALAERILGEESALSELFLVLVTATGGARRIPLALCAATLRAQSEARV